MKKLFTPGPLNTSLAVKEAALVDMGSRDKAFIDAVRFVRDELLQVATVDPGQYTTIILQGSGTYAVESVISSVIAQNDKLLILINGVYGERMRKIASVYNINHTCLIWPENEAITPDRVEDALTTDAAITHIIWVHSETTTGLFNPVNEIAALCRKYNKTGILDAMSSFGASAIELQGSGIEFLVSSSNKCIQGTPGFAFVIAGREALKKAEGNARTLALDLYDQWRGLESNGQFRFTPPTLALMSFKQALLELKEEGGVSAREARYKHNNQIIRLRFREMGFNQYLDDSIQGHIITTFLFPYPEFDFTTFYDRLSEQGCVIYPGKLTRADTFRIGNIGDLHESDMWELADAVRSVCAEMGVNITVG